MPVTTWKLLHGIQFGRTCGGLCLCGQSREANSKSKNHKKIVSFSQYTRAIIGAFGFLGSSGGLRETCGDSVSVGLRSGATGFGLHDEQEY